jgi:hypothetical protein
LDLSEYLGFALSYPGYFGLTNERLIHKEAFLAAVTGRDIALVHDAIRNGERSILVSYPRYITYLITREIGSVHRESSKVASPRVSTDRLFRNLFNVFENKGAVLSKQMIVDAITRIESLLTFSSDENTGFPSHIITESKKIVVKDVSELSDDLWNNQTAVNTLKRFSDSIFYHYASYKKASKS